MKINNFQEINDGIVSGTSVAFKVSCGGEVLVEDSLAGKVTYPYSKSYEVDFASGPLELEHNRHDLPYLEISASRATAVAR